MPPPPPPVLVRRVPAGQALQAVLPGLAVRPEAHASHGVVRFCSSEAVFSAHGSHAVWPVKFWNWPGMHGRQIDCPARLLYLPRAQSVQLLLLLPLLLLLLLLLLPPPAAAASDAELTVPAAHCWHVFSPESP
jgi:hypothetical protein